MTKKCVIDSFFDYHRFGTLRVILKRLRGRKPDYSGYPTKGAFDAELAQVGFKGGWVEPTGGAVGGASLLLADQEI